MRLKARYGIGIEMVEDSEGKIDFWVYAENNGDMPTPPVITLLATS